jgi:hypothetical protein
MIMTKPTSSKTYAGETRVLRHLSETLSLYGLCTRPACRRVRACRGEPRDCLSRYAPLVPQDARDGAKTMLDGWLQNLSFDELIENEEAREEVAALGEWTRAVEKSCQARVTSQRADRAPRNPSPASPPAPHRGPRVRSL